METDAGFYCVWLKNAGGGMAKDSAKAKDLERL